MVVLDVNGDFGVTGLVGYVCRGRSVDFDNLVGGFVVGWARRDAEEVLVCHSTFN